MKKYSEIKTLIYSAVTMIICVIIFALTEKIDDLSNYLGTPGFNSFYFIFKYFILNPILFSIIPLINFSIIYFVIPKDPTAKKIFIIGFFDILFCLIISYVSAIIFSEKNVKEQLMTIFSAMLFFGMISGTIKFLVLYRNSFVDALEFNKKHLESKNALHMLQAQLNPHFLFNSLNNIDILVEETPKKASEYLKKLSDILRYVLYETKVSETELSKEIEQIKSYIELQKIRTDNAHYVNFNIKGELKDQKIAPMIFIPFIENAFKHCKNKTIENAIDIQFEIDKEKVKMICKNYYEENQLEIIKSEGLGIETIKQRLNLLYPKNHELIIDKTGNWFNVSLSIDLKDAN
jgi:two-component system, LytTR family, sensor kinase